MSFIGIGVLLHLLSELPFKPQLLICLCFTFLVSSLALVLGCCQCARPFTLQRRHQRVIEELWVSYLCSILSYAHHVLTSYVHFLCISYVIRYPLAASNYSWYRSRIYSQHLASRVGRWLAYLLRWEHCLLCYSLLPLSPPYPIFLYCVVNNTLIQANDNNSLQMSLPLKIQY